MGNHMYQPSKSKTPLTMFSSTLQGHQLNPKEFQGYIYVFLGLNDLSLCFLLDLQVLEDEDIYIG
jgi:hypothetical protein